MQLDRMNDLDLAEIELLRKGDDIVTALVRRVRLLEEDVHSFEREVASLRQELQDGAF